MRELLVAYLKTLSLGTIGVSDELPWTKDGDPLYIKNYKKIYVDRPLITQDALINTLAGSSIVNQTTAVTAYLTVDAKNQPSNLAQVISDLTAARGEIQTANQHSRTCSVTQEYQGDALVATFEYSFIELLT